MKIFIFVACISIILIHFAIGAYKINHLQRVCTEKITTKDISLKKYNSFGLIYYSAKCKFLYKDKEYCVNKALFGKQYENIKEIDVNINPENPDECYLIKISQRGCGGCFVMLLLFVTIISLFLLFI